MKSRLLTKQLQTALTRNKSVLLLGARQAGKTTLIKALEHDLLINFALPRSRIEYESNMELLEQQIKALKPQKEVPLVIIDEVQKIPEIMDLIQYMIDENLAQFILTGSSARKLKNLLPGRVVKLKLDPLTLDEIDTPALEIKDLLLYGSLPGIVTQEVLEHRETDLASYVEVYLEEEIRSESLVRNLASFNRFLYFAAVESGNILNLSKISQDIGVTHNTISSYYQILSDCLIVERVDPITTSSTRRQLTKSPKMLFFDLGLRRLAANEGVRLPEEYFGRLFEQFVGLELLRRGRLINPRLKLCYWRDSSGPEVDWILSHQGKFIPLEVKWTQSPKAKDIRHLEIFCREYGVSEGYVICRCTQKLKLTDNIYAIPWQQIDNFCAENIFN